MEAVGTRVLPWCTCFLRSKRTRNYTQNLNLAVKFWVFQLELDANILNEHTNDHEIILGSLGYSLRVYLLYIASHKRRKKPRHSLARLNITSTAATCALACIQHNIHTYHACG